MYKIQACSKYFVYIFIFPAAIIRSASPPLFTTVKHAEVGVGTLKALLSKPPCHSMTDSVSIKSSGKNKFLY